MTLYEKIIEIYPELKEKDFHPVSGVIHLQNNSDGNGDFISYWGYEKTQPADDQLNLEN